MLPANEPSSSNDHSIASVTSLRRPSVSGSSSRSVDSSQAGKSAFNWEVYKNRKTALQHLKRNYTLVDTILETEDGCAYELVHSQVISAFGDRLNQYINQNGTYVESYKTTVFQGCRRRGLAAAAVVPSPTTVILPGQERGSSSSSPSSGRLEGKGPHQQWSRWPGRVKLIRLPKLNRYTLSILVECAYTGYIRTDLPSGGIWQVLEVADHYEMVEVIRACCAFLVKNLDRLNCVHFYHVGIKHKHPLQRCAWHKIRANFKYILEDTLRQQTTGSQSQPYSKVLVAEEEEQRRNNLATIKYEHFEPLLMHDKLNIDSEESLWYAIRSWCNYNLHERASKLASLLPCMRFPRFRTGTEFSARYIWRDPLVLNDAKAQQQLAILDRNHRDFLTTGPSFLYERDGFSLPCAPSPRQLRPRVPHSILLAIGGWQQGQPTTLIESYDSNCNLWFESRKRIMAPLAYHGIEYINGLLYICGGTDGTEILNEVFTFDPVRGDCAQRASMREPRCYVSTAYIDGYLYAMGGHNGIQRMKSVERLELAGQLWNHIQDMNVARSDASACVHNSLIYIAGGLNDQVIESSVEFYNSLDNSWTFVASMMTPRTSFTLLMYNEHLLAIGGNNGTERLSSVEEYSFQNKLWSHHSDMRSRRSTFSAAILDQRRLVVVGGYNGQTPFNQVETFDEETRTWLSLQKIRFDRSGLKVVVVSDLANAADYTFLGSVGASEGPPHHTDGQGSARAPVSLAARARHRFLRSIGAARPAIEGPQREAADQPPDQTNSDQ